MDWCRQDDRREDFGAGRGGRREFIEGSNLVGGCLAGLWDWTQLAFLRSLPCLRWALLQAWNRRLSAVFIVILMVLFSEETIFFSRNKLVIFLS